jgi:putative restriction endonuclease
LKQNATIAAARPAAFITDVGSALRAYADFLDRPARDEQAALAEFETVAQATVLARRGQQQFRAALFRYWQGRCVVTDIDRPAVLRASHVKPWMVSSGLERVDPFNGLLLAAHLDALFDRALISFGESGELLISRTLNPRERAVFGLAAVRQQIALAAPHQDYMRHHRDRFAANR